MMTNNINRSTNRYTYLSIGLLITLALIFLSVILFSSVSAFDPNATKYVFVKKWGSRGMGDGQFLRVHDINFDGSEKRISTLRIQRTIVFKNFILTVHL